jgi:hypothetical protein
MNDEYNSESSDRRLVWVSREGHVVCRLLLDTTRYTSSHKKVTLTFRLYIAKLYIISVLSKTAAKMAHVYDLESRMFYIVCCSELEPAGINA